MHLAHAPFFAPGAQRGPESCFTQWHRQPHLCGQGQDARHPGQLHLGPPRWI